MTKMIEIEQAHWIDPDTIYQMLLTDDQEVRNGHRYYGISLKGRSEYGDTTLGAKLTAIQANRLMRRIANAQSKPEARVRL